MASQVRGDGRPVAARGVRRGAAGWPGADRDSLYAGIAGLAPVLAEIGRCRALTGAEQALAAGIVARLSAMAVTRAEPSLYDGLAGDVTALKLLAPGRERVALARLAELMTPDGWPSTLGIEPEPAAPVTESGLWQRRGGARRDLGRRPGRRRRRRGRRRGPAARRTGARPRAVRPRRRPGLGDAAGIAVPVSELLARHRRGSHRACHRGGGPGPGGLHRGSPGRRAAPARRGLADRRGVHHPAHACPIPAGTWNR